MNSIDKTSKLTLSRAARCNSSRVIPSVPRYPTRPAATAPPGEAALPPSASLPRQIRPQMARLPSPTALSCARARRATGFRAGTGLRARRPPARLRAHSRAAAAAAAWRRRTGGAVERQGRDELLQRLPSAPRPSTPTRHPHAASSATCEGRARVQPPTHTGWAGRDGVGWRGSGRHASPGGGHTTAPRSGGPACWCGRN
jgi:hypothetical protein